MCFALYLGADEPLPVLLVGDVEEQFYLRALEGSNDQAALDKFSKPYVYYAASWQDCGCGWFVEPVQIALTAKRRAQMRSKAEELTAQCVVALRALMTDLLSRSDYVELFLTWEGKQREQPDRKLGLTLDDFVDSGLPLDEGDFAVVTARPLG